MTKLFICLFGNTRDTSFMHENAKFVLFIYMQPQKVKFISVHINMKRVSYAWVKVLRIIPEFRILRPTFFGKSASKC